MKRDVRKDPKPAQMWAVYNWGILWEVFHLRREALEFARKEAADNGFETNWRKIYEIHKVMVTKIG